jgi:hypothetical protein
LHAFIPVLRCDADFENVEKKDNVDIFIDPQPSTYITDPTWQWRPGLHI